MEWRKQDEYIAERNGFTLRVYRRSLGGNWASYAVNKDTGYREGTFDGFDNPEDAKVAIEKWVNGKASV